MNYLEIFILIMVSFSPLLSQPMKAILVLILVILNIRLGKKFNKKKTLILMIFLFLFTISSIYDLRNINSLSEINVLTLFLPLCFILGFLISEKYKAEEYFHYIERLVFIIAIFSLIGVTIYTFLPSLVFQLPIYNYYHTSHSTAYIFNILTDEFGVVRRNAGIAWEPGAFQFILNLGLYLYIKCNAKVNLYKLVIYSIAIISTKSTAGLLIFLFITFGIFMKDRKARIIIIGTVIAFGGLIIQEILYQYEYKLFGSNAFEYRSEPLLNAFEVGKNYFLGMGNSGFDIYYRSHYTPPWDSLGQILIRYGYPLLFFILLRLLNLLNGYKILFLILLVTFLSQNVWFFPLITPFYFIVSNQYEVKVGMREV